MRENGHNISKFDINDLKRGDKVIILSKNLIGTIVDINRYKKIALVIVIYECRTYIVNLDDMRKVIKVEK